jgi:hypothetical protein
VVGSCEYCNEPLSSMKGREFLSQLIDDRLLKKGCSIKLVRELNGSVLKSLRNMRVQETR